MFNLEKALSDWRAKMLSSGVKNQDIVDELESHLREDWARRVESGESEDQAFQCVVQGIGTPGSLKEEFAKVARQRGAWLRKFTKLLAGALDPLPSLSTFTPAARLTLELARQEAPRLNHGFVGTEHVLLGLLALEDGIVPNVLKRMGVDRESVRRQVEHFVSGFPLSKNSDRLPYTPRVTKSLRFATKEAKANKDGRVGAEHIFLGLLLERDGVAGRVLREFGLNSGLIREEIKKEANRIKGSN